ncbi:hypothetical protein RB653_000677 [Dictyostelium firmibasis]|uniref:Major facilitator superfamily (MFS) profile domain-containing protein n=1 Tax=Dictyostelium firmibasis TaxID=79012 RepID=A0AAN7YQT9_9MYCE
MEYENNNPSVINEGNYSISNQSSHDYSINEYSDNDSSVGNESLIGLLEDLANIDDEDISPLLASSKINISASVHDFGKINEDDIDGAQEHQLPIGSTKKSAFAPFIEHKYKKDLILVLLMMTFMIMADLVYALFIPNVFLNYVRINFPDETDIQTKATYYKSFSDSIPYISMFCFGALAGVLSDKYGRKLMFYYGSVVVILDMISCYVTIKTNNLYYYYVVHGFAGTYNVSLAAVYSYIADISEEHQVPFLYSMVGVSLGLGIVLGPVISVVSTIHETIQQQQQLPMTTLYIACGLVASTLFIIPFLKESLTIAKENNKIRVTKSSSNPFKLIKMIFSANGYVALVIVLYTLISYTQQDVFSTYYYHNELVYNWSGNDNSYYMGGIGILMIIWSLVLIPLLLKRYSERKLISVGFLIATLTHISFSFAFNQWIWVASGIVAAFVPNVLYLLQSVISRATPPEIKGSILTGSRAIGSLAGFLGSLAASNMYREFTSGNTIYFPGAPYLINSVVLFSTFIASLIIWKKYKNPNPLIRKNVKKKIAIIKKSTSLTNISLNVDSINN